MTTTASLRAWHRPMRPRRRDEEHRSATYGYVVMRLAAVANWARAAAGATRNGGPPP